MSKFRPKKSSTWRTQHIAGEQQRLAQQFKAAEESGGAEARLNAILQQVRKLSSEELDSQKALTLHLSVMFALSHHERHGGIPPAEIKKLIYTAHGILQTNGIQPISSKLAFLYGELHLVQSQIHLREGNFWRSSWEQQLASYFSGAGVPGGEAFQALSLGIRALRLGNSAMALKHFTAAQQGDISTAAREKALIGTVRTLRLGGQLKDVCTMIAKLEKEKHSKDFLLELQWEKLCCALNEDPDTNLLPMLNCVKRTGTHYTESYLLEAFLWSRAVLSPQWLEALPKMATLARNKALGIDKKSFLYQCALVLEEAYDEQIPLVRRLQNMADMVDDAAKLRNVDKELLVWLAATRWLARNKHYVLATTCFLEYQAKCRRLSEGRSADVLGIASDLFKKPWLLNVGQ